MHVKWHEARDVNGEQVVLLGDVEVAMRPPMPSQPLGRKVVIQQANIAAIARPLAYHFAAMAQSHLTMVYVQSVFYSHGHHLQSLTQQDEFCARRPKLYCTARIVARTERTY
jgi:hypothetical protein